MDHPAQQQPSESQLEDLTDARPRPLAPEQEAAVKGGIIIVGGSVAGYAPVAYAPLYQYGLRR